MPKTFSKIAIIGAGRVGTALAFALGKTGRRVVFVANNTAHSTRRSAKVLKSREHSVHISNIPVDTDLIIIASPAQAIPKIVRELSINRTMDFQGVFVIHTSGVHSSRLLESLKRKGAKIAAIHPIQTFPAVRKPNDSVSSMKGIYYGIDAPRNDLRTAKSLVSLLGGEFVIIPERLRPLYHALCVFSSGYVVQLLGHIEEISAQFNFTEHWYAILGPLLKTSIHNSIKTSPASALTGPIMRGDLATVKLHLQSLKRYAPPAVSAYKILGADMARGAFRKKSINRTTLNKLLKIFSV